MPNNTLKITEHNAITNETFTRDFTEEENNQYQIDMDIVKQLKAEAEAKAAARQTILDRLGLTEEEARILLGGN